MAVGPVGPPTSRGPTSAWVEVGVIGSNGKPVPALPGRPGPVSVVRSVAGETVTVSWTAPIVGGAVATYVVTRGDGLSWTAGNNTSMVLRCQRLDACTFSVHAVNVAGSSSESVAGVASSPARPTAVLDQRTVQSPSGLATLTWVPPVSPGAAAILGYQVVWRVIAPNGALLNPIKGAGFSVCAERDVGLVSVSVRGARSDDWW